MSEVTGEATGEPAGQGAAQELWGPHPMRHGQALRFELGPMSLHVARLEEEWRLRHTTAREPLREVLGYYDALVGDAVGEPEIEERVAAHDAAELRDLQLQPLLADRLVLARPDVPITVLEGSRVFVFVTTPLWVRLRRAPEGELIAELPSYRPSDSWLGPPSGDGPLCYASRTTARLTLGQLHASPMRATTKIELRNDGSTLRVQRLIVPAPQLRLYRDAGGRFWTDEVTVTRGRDGAFSAVRLDGQPPVEAGAVKLVADAREIGTAHVVLRALGSLFGGA